MSYDEKCEELARYFLQERPDSADAIKGLAQAIQDAVEDWLTCRGWAECSNGGPS